MDGKDEEKVNPELTNSRTQLLEIKRALDLVLKDDQGDYWARMQDFFIGKINRVQLEFFIRGLLTAELVKLHNEFVKLALKCALLPTEPPGRKASEISDEPKTYGKKRKWKTLDDMNLHLQVKKLIKLRGKKEFSRLKTLAQKPSKKVEFPYSIPITLPPLAGEAAAFYGCGIQIPLCSESKLLPNLEMMRIKANTIALENGLTEGADPRVAEVILQGLETHLESLLTNCLFKIRLKQTRSALSAGPLLTEQNTITTRDLQTTFTISPYLLAERPNAIERLVTIHNPAFPPEIISKPLQNVLQMFVSRKL